MMVKRIFVSNCEGPISLNDNAFELTVHFVPEGDRVFDILTRYDYLHAYFSKKKDYMVGNASKLILPFLLAYDATNQNVEEFSAANLVLLKNSKGTLNYVRNISHAFVVSKSYEHHIRAICRETGFPLENTYCTNANLDKFELTAKEKAKLKSLAWEIGGMSPINIPPNIKSLKDLSSKDQATVSRLDKIFWKEVAGTCCKQIYADVNASLTAEKASTVQSLVNSLATPLRDIIYVGSDATDSEAMKLVRASGGLAMAFNGDEAIVRNADVAVISGDSAPIAILADLFLRFGKEEATKIAGNFEKDVLWLTAADPDMLNQIFQLYPKAWPKAYIVSEWNMQKIINESGQFRKTIQGEPATKR